MSAGLLGPVLCLLLEDEDFLDLLFELFCPDEDLFFFLGLTVEQQQEKKGKHCVTEC